MHFGAQPEAWSKHAGLQMLINRDGNDRIGEAGYEDQLVAERILRTPQLPKLLGKRLLLLGTKVSDHEDLKRWTVPLRRSQVADRLRAIGSAALINNLYSPAATSLRSLAIR
jgi:hypothetical protein